jgi:hypothetical protein
MGGIGISLSRRGMEKAALAVISDFKLYYSQSKTIFQSDSEFSVRDPLLIFPADITFSVFRIQGLTP